MQEERVLANAGPEVFLENSLPKQPRKRFIGRRAATANASASGLAAAGSDGDDDVSKIGRVQSPLISLQTTAPARIARVLNQIPREILDDPALQAAIAHLPSNYNFEIPKTIHRIRSSGSRSIALQFPEGLLLFAPLISDILTSFCSGTDTLIMGDVTYGACCIDDYTARALGCDLLVHYGHSCLVPMDQTGGIKTLYVFVTIGIDADHLIRTIESNFLSGKKIALVGTIQFNATLHAIVPQLRSMGFEILLPRSSPLSAGEILGCTAPSIVSRRGSLRSDTTTALPPDADMILYVGDGRFHLESILIASPSLRSQTYRYDPYSRRLAHETYEHNEMRSLRRHAINTARHTLDAASKRTREEETSCDPITWGIILGTLGRQGNPHTWSLITAHLTRLRISFISLLLSEIQPAKLSLMSRDVGVWVQIACPRLSIDWGYAFERPLLSPYEAMVALGVHNDNGDQWMKESILDSNGHLSETTEGNAKEVNDEAHPGAAYPMNFYSKDGLGRTSIEDVPSVYSELEIR